MTSASPGGREVPERLPCIHCIAIDRPCLHLIMCFVTVCPLVPIAHKWWSCVFLFVLLIDCLKVVGAAVGCRGLPWAMLGRNILLTVCVDALTHAFACVTGKRRGMKKDEKHKVSCVCFCVCVLCVVACDKQMVS